MMVSNTPLRVDEIQRRPILVPEGTPNDMIVVDRDRMVDLHVLHGPANVAYGLLEFELGRMDSDDYQSMVLVFLGPSADIGQRAPPIDAGISPEIDQHDVPAQGRRRQ